MALHEEDTHVPLESTKNFSTDIEEIRKELRDLKNQLRREPSLSIGDWGGADGFQDKQLKKKGTIGWPFAPVARMTMTKGDINQIVLRGSVWTAVLVAPLLLPLDTGKLVENRKVDEETGTLVNPFGHHCKQTVKDGKEVNKIKHIANGYIGWCYYKVPTMVALGLSATIQIVFAYYMHSMPSSEKALSEDDDPGRCDQEASFPLRYVAVCVFLAYGLGSEVTEAMVTNRWLSAFPSWNFQAHPGVIDRVIERDGLAGLSQLIFQEATNHRGQSCFVPAVGLTCTFKWSCKIFLVLGRIIIAGMIMVEAAGLILYSPTNREVLESAVAATFVLDIDNYVYHFLVTDVVKERMAAVPPIGVSNGIGKTFTDDVWQGYGSYFMFAVLIAAATALSFGWCRGGDDVYIAWAAFLFPLLICVALGACGTLFNWNPNPKGDFKQPKEYRKEYTITDKDYTFAQDSGRLEAQRAGRAPVDRSLSPVLFAVGTV